MNKHTKVSDKAKDPLIEAAPEMLAALHIALMQIRADYNIRIQQPVEKSANELIMSVIEKAIKKAEGR